MNDPQSRLAIQDASLEEATLSVAIVFTRVEATLAALRHAAGLAHGLNARIQILVPRIVPYPLPVTDSPVREEFEARSFRTLAEQHTVAASIHICLCRDRLEMLEQRLAAGSAVLIGVRKSRRRWWPNRDRRLAAELRKAGHQVIEVECEGSHA